MSTVHAAAEPTSPAAGSPPRVYGLDLSLTGSGIASSSGWCEVIGRDGITTMPLPERDAIIYSLAHDITQLIGPNADLVVIEAPAYSRHGGGAHERAGLWWRVVHRLLGWSIPIVEVYSNQRCTYATGKHIAKKTEIVEAVTRRWPLWQTEGNDNAADAVVIMAMGLDYLGAPLTPMPAKNATALLKVKWPELAVTV